MNHSDIKSTGDLEGSEARARLRDPGRWGLAIAVVALALAFGVLEAWQGRFTYRGIPAPLFWPEALARTIPSWLIVALLCPGVFALARAVRIDRRAWVLPLLVHVAGSAVFVFLHLVGMAIVVHWRHGGDPTFGEALSSLLTRYAVEGTFKYWVLVAIVHVVRHQSEMRDRERAESELRASLSEARLAALRSQLNPHFLFNTLNSISTLAMTGDRDRLVRAISSLSELLRIMLDECPEPMTPLSRELAILDRYLDLQAIRFGPRLEVRRDITPEAQGASVPSLILQPIVENAIVHGVGARRGGGIVALRARREGGDLVLEVQDSGPGFPRAHDDGTAPREGIGLSNTRTRLEAMYGQSHRFECGSAPEGGALVRIVIPWKLHNPGSHTGRVARSVEVGP